MIIFRVFFLHKFRYFNRKKRAVNKIYACLVAGKFDDSAHTYKCICVNDMRSIIRDGISKASNIDDKRVFSVQQQSADNNSPFYPR